jgi:4-amino-4-deoxy-L-arabinose transferase-like glycosyltransferase
VSITARTCQPDDRSQEPARARISPITGRDALALVLILLVAAVMRFGEPGIVEFYHDEAMLSMRAQEMAAGETFPTEGILSSVGIPNPPTSVYVMWLPYLLTDDPLFATLYVAALNVMGVGLLWLLARRGFGRTAALAAGLAYALNPWAVLYSRKIWAQDFHTPFVLAALLLGVYGFVESAAESGRSAASPLGGTKYGGRFLAQALCLPVLLFGLQIHFAAWALLPLYAWVPVAGRRQISRRAGRESGAGGAGAAALCDRLCANAAKDPYRISDVIGRSGMSGGWL